MSLTAAVIPLRRLAAFYDRTAHWAAEKLGDPLTQAYVGWISSLRAAGEGHWEHVESGAGGAIESAAHLGDLRLRVMSLETLSSAAAMQGDFERAADLSQTLVDVANEQGNRLWEAWALNSFSEVTYLRGDDEATIERCQRALDILAEESDRAEEIRANGIMAAALLRQGHSDEALAVAHRTADLIATWDLTAFNTYEGFAGVCEVTLSLAKSASARGGVVPPTLWKDAQRACAALRKFARIFPIGRPRYGIARARLLALRGRQNDAVNALECAVGDAEILRMPHEQGLALMELGRCDWLPETTRQDFLERALVLLSPGFARRQVKQLLEGLWQ